MTPESSPLIAASLVCRECGKTMKMKVIFKKRGQKQVVSHLEYTCTATMCPAVITRSSQPP